MNHFDHRFGGADPDMDAYGSERPEVCQVCADPCNTSCDLLERYEELLDQLDLFDPHHIGARVERIMIMNEMEGLEAQSKALPPPNPNA